MSSENGSPGPMLTRRNALKVGAGAGAATLGLSGSGLPDSVAPVQETEAIPPLIVWGAAAAGGMATGWALRELEVLGANPPPDGLTPEALQLETYHRAKMRKSVNASTFMDNKNMIGYMPESLFSKGKLAALEAMNNGKSEQEAIDAGKKAAQSQMAIAEKNFVKSWNESLNELYSMAVTIQDHDNLNVSDVIVVEGIDEGYNWSGAYDVSQPETTLTLRDGSSFTMNQWKSSDKTIGITGGSGGAIAPAIVPGNGDPAIPYIIARDPDDLHPTAVWSEVWAEMQNTFDDILNNISLWVNNTYSGVQTGEISPDEYLDGVDLANTISADSERAQAIADLIANNIPGDYKNSVKVHLKNDDAKAQGYLFSTDPGSNESIAPGTVIDPNATDDSGNPLYGDWYFAFLPASWIESIEYYDADYGIQGGEMLFTENPNQSDGETMSPTFEYAITTSKGETAYFDPSNAVETVDENSNTVWAADLSDQLENLIANIAEVRLVFNDPPDEFRTMLLDQTFEILEIDGADSVTIQEHRDAQNDSNYTTDEEWQVLIDQQKELIDKYEDSTSSAGGGWSPDFDVPTWGPLDSIEDWGLAAIVAVVGSAVFGNLS